MRLFVVSLIFCYAAFCKTHAQEQSDIPKYPEPEAILESMKKATQFYRSNLSFAGGYARAWSRDLRASHVEGAQGGAMVSIQPHGTTTVGLAMLRAYVETGDPLFLQGAKEAVESLAWCQLASGGWPRDFNYELRAARNFHFRRDVEAGDLEIGNRSARSTLDDNKTQSAIRFLAEFSEIPESDGFQKLNTALAFAWDGLLAAQAPNGGWPQQFTGAADSKLPVKQASFPSEWPRKFPAVDYTPFYTLNDNNLVHVAELLLSAHESENADSSRFLDAAKRLGDFLLMAQLPEPQPGWAQQYNFEMHPAWARKFEPPAISSLESLGAIDILIKIWLATGDEKYIATIPDAIAWLERSVLEEEEFTWARLYELETNIPLYLTAETYELTHDDSDLPAHYGFEVKISSKIKKVKEIIGRTHDENIAKRERDSSPPENEKEWAKLAAHRASKARNALKSQKDDGYWVEGPLIDAGQFVRQMAALTAYLEAAKMGGETFAKLRKREVEKDAAAKKADAE